MYGVHTSLQGKPDGWTLSFTRILSQVLHNKWIFNDSNVQAWYHDS